MNPDLKREIILEHNSNPRNKRVVDDNTFDKLNANNASCIDKFDLQVKIEKNIIQNIYFSGEGCAISTSTTSIMISLLTGKTVSDAISIISEYLKMINEQDYDETVLEEAIVFNEIYKQANRIKCASLTWEVMLDYLKERI